ncbi:MAG: hypothetical protein LBR07_01705 [Puniceicoccales bacterium]|nr:hypothetical protein [Puniceicoccales bacterium]
MSTFISDQLAKFLNSRLEDVGRVTALDVGRDGVTATLELRGEPEPLQLSLTGISWDAADGRFHLHYTGATASKEWLQALLVLLGKRFHQRVSLPDKFSLMPLKMLFPKKGAAE